MNRRIGLSFILAHSLLIALIICIFLPGAKEVKPATAMLVAIGLIEADYLWRLYRAQKKGRSLKAPSDIVCIIWAFLLIWEICCTKLAITHPVLIPAPENVFNVFPTQYHVLLANVGASLELLLIGIIVGIAAGVVLGMIIGWIPRLREALTPIANVIAPIPPVVYSPYLIALMPTFRSASALTILLGVFFPTLLGMIIRVGGIEPAVLESARSLNVKTGTMLTHIVFPYVLPGVVSGLKVTVTTSTLLLVFAEMMGATSGMGYYIINYNSYANYTNVVAGIIVVGLVVTILSRCVTLIEKKSIPWQ